MYKSTERTKHSIFYAQKFFSPNKKYNKYSTLSHRQVGLNNTKTIQKLNKSKRKQNRTKLNDNFIF